MQSRTPLTPFEAAQMRAYTFSISVIGSMAFSETLKTLETIKEESLQCSRRISRRRYRQTQGRP